MATYTKLLEAGAGSTATVTTLLVAYWINAPLVLTAIIS